MSARMEKLSENNFAYTMPLHYEDGYKIAVTWEDHPTGAHAPGYWVARLTGCEAESEPIGCGASQVEALFCLACSLASLADAICYTTNGGGAVTARGDDTK